MSKELQILGIETSCDETAASVVSISADGRGEILSNVILSQIEDHRAFGGVVPEIAARAHSAAVEEIVRAALADANTIVDDLDAIAATSGPGLIGGLIVGLMTGKAIAAATECPFYAINHLEGHALTARLTDNIAFPYLMLLVSGGHTQILLVRGVGDYSRWGTTIDDALGEAFDKTAKLLGLDYPGGPAVEQAARTGNPATHRFPIPLRGTKRLDFSFSGLKTAVRQAAEAKVPLSQQDISDICASFQHAVSGILSDRVSRSLQRFRDEFGSCPTPTLVVAGGVAANQELRNTLTELSEAYGFRFLAPPHRLCTDNAAMIAWAAGERMRLALPAAPMNTAPRSRWPLDPNAATKIGHGKRGAKA